MTNFIEEFYYVNIDPQARSFEQNNKKAFVVSNERTIKTDGKITYLPICYVMFFKKCIFCVSSQTFFRDTLKKQVRWALFIVRKVVENRGFYPGDFLHGK